jgi:tripeptide aminopeptidase
MSVQEKFLQYVRFDTQSDETSTSAPSTAKQLVLAKELENQMKALGLESVSIDEGGTVYGILPANAQGYDAIGLIAHMDTASELTGANVNPQIVENYDGGTIVLNEEYSMSPAQFPVLEKFIGDDLITTDGTTLLGADDKAGIAIIMEAVEQLIASGKEHGLVAVAFTPDEEIGRGVDNFDLSRFPVDYAFTLDGGDTKAIDYETFNAASAVVSFQGTAIHPGDSKGKMVNASLVAMEFNALLPALQIPAHTSGRQGFYHLTEMSGTVDHAELHYILREHDRAKFEAEKETVLYAAEQINKKYPDCCSVAIRDQYSNMVDYMNGDFRSIEKAKKAFEAKGITPVSTPIRGGTDGAMLTKKGLITPNLGTGSANHHGRFEFASIQKMNAMVELVDEILSTKSL